MFSEVFVVGFGEIVSEVDTSTFLPYSLCEYGVGCVFSVALSRRSPRVAVSHHRALSCSDFPPPPFCFAKAKQQGRPPNPLL